MLSHQEILIRLGLAALFGALIGLERERKNWTAGLRTHMMVSVGSCLIMIVSAFGFADILGSENVSLDPSRVAAQVVSGIGFLGAGTILFLKRGVIKGLTTASGLWTVAAIGLATGGGLYFAAGATTVIALIILWALVPIEHFYGKKFKHKTLQIITSAEIKNNKFLKSLLNSHNLPIESFIIEKVDDEFTYLITLEDSKSVNILEITDKIKDEYAIKEISWVK